MPTRTLFTTILLLVGAGRARAQQVHDLTPYLMNDRIAEISLARTAAPRRISDSATVLVLTKTGYTEASRGTNGFTCVVLRSFDGTIGAADFWKSNNRGPQCFNAAAARSVLLELRKRSVWIAAGVSTGDLATKTQRAYASHEFPTPLPGAMGYMMSPSQILSDDDPHWMPHVMFYHDRSMPASAWGAGGFADPLIDASADDKKSPVVTVLIPLRQWSDGTPATHTSH